MRRLLHILIFFACWTYSLPRLAAAYPDNAASPLGTNLWFFRDWVSEYPLVDAFKSSRPWITQYMDSWPTTWDTGESALLDLDADGWVRSLPAPADAPVFTSVGTLMLDGFGAHYPAGRYIVLYEGEGTILYGFDAVKDNALSASGRDVLNVTPTGNGIYLRIAATDPHRTGNYLRNIRVLMPGSEDSYASQVFHPDFLAKLTNYRAVRPMQWAETNGSAQEVWSARTRMSQARWNNHGYGVPVELMVALANRLQQDLWVNMPHKADDDFMTRYALLVKGLLHPALKVYVEYSNEVWNGSYEYPQSLWVQSQGKSRWPASPESDFTKQINWHGMRTARMCDLWKAAWAGDSARVICVMGAQSGNPWTASQALDCPLWTEGAPCYRHGIDAVAIGPYFGWYLGTSTYQTQVLGWLGDADGGLAKLFAEVTSGGVLSGAPAGGALARAFQEMDGHAAVAAARGLYLTAYEGGSHLASVSGNAAVSNLFSQASRDARMQQVYADYLAGWKARGGHIFMHYFNVGQNTTLGSFGVLEYLDQPESPKWNALQQFIAENPCWWTGCARSASLNFFTYLPFLRNGPDTLR